MFNEFARDVQRLDNAEFSLASREIRNSLCTLPLEVFGQLLWKTPWATRFAHIAAAIPDMPEPDIQARFAGSHGYSLLPKAYAFMRIFETLAAQCLRRPLVGMNILDYGCGWGRLSRFFLRHASPDGLWMLDPNAQMIKLLSDQRFPANIRHIAPEPANLNLPEKFDIVVLFSIFTHLPDWLVEKVMASLYHALDPKGVVMFSVRPKEFWSYSKEYREGFSEAGQLKAHDDRGHAFMPSKASVSNNRPLYGDASFSHEYIRRLLPHWKVVRREVSSMDPFHIIYCLQKA